MKTAHTFGNCVFLAIVVFLAACQDRTGPVQPRAPANVLVMSGDAQVGVVAQELPAPLVVQVVDAAGMPVAGSMVEFRAGPASGKPRVTSVSADANGLARCYWTLGTTARVTQQLEAIARGAGGKTHSATFSATGTPDVLSQILKTAGDGQTGSLGAALAESLVVVAADRFGNGIGATTVAWTVSSGGGTVAPRATATDALGFLKASWVLGVRLDVPHVVTVTTAGLAPATFAAVAQLPASAKLEVFGGNAQRDTVGKAVAESLAARVTLADGRPIEGATVVWAVTEGGGAISPASSVTDRDGVARADWTLGTRTGENRVTATAAPLDRATFAATGLADVPASVTKALGDGQHGVPGQLAPDSIAVIVRDRYDNVVPGTPVVFAISAGDGTPSATTVVTDDAGRAAIAFRLGPAGTENRITATAGNAPPATFTVSGTPGSDWTLVIRAGDGQTAQTKGSLTGLEVRLTDGRGRPVTGATVTWQSIGGGSPGAAVTSTNAEGIASNSWSVGCPARQTMTASVQDLPPVTFTAEVAQRPAYLASFRFQGTRGPMTAYSTHAIRVTVRDQVGCPVSGVEAPWSITPLASAPDATWPLISKIEAVAGPASDSAGQIDYVLRVGGMLRWNPFAILPRALTPYFSDSTGGFFIAPSAIVRSLRITPSSALIPNPGSTATFQVIAADEAGRLLWNAADWRVLDPTVVTGERVSYDSFRVTGVKAGITAVVAEHVERIGEQDIVWPADTALVRVRDLSDSTASVSAGNLSDLVGSIGSPTELIAYTRDSAGVPVADATVTWALESGNGTLTAVSSVSDSRGEARVAFTPGPASGSNVVTATLSGVGMARYLVWTPAAAPVRIAQRRGDGQTGFVGHPLADSISVRVEDQHGNGVYDEEVVFAMVTGGGHVERTKLRTDTLGVVSTRWTPGTLGANTASATWSGHSVTFTATATTGGGLGVVMPNGSETFYSARRGGTPATPLFVVRVVDDQGTPVSGATVTWSGGGAIRTTVTDSLGFTSLAPEVMVSSPMTMIFTARVSSGATAVFSVVVTPSSGPTYCSPHILGSSTAQVATRLPGPVVVSCFSNTGVTITTVPVSVSGGSLMPVPGYRVPGEWRYYWVMPSVPGTYKFESNGGIPPSPQSVWATATP